LREEVVQIGSRTLGCGCITGLNLGLERSQIILDREVQIPVFEPDRTFEAVPLGLDQIELGLGVRGVDRGDGCLDRGRQLREPAVTTESSTISSSGSPVGSVRPEVAPVCFSSEPHDVRPSAEIPSSETAAIESREAGSRRMMAVQ